MANAPKASNAKAKDLVKFWTKRLKELREQCNGAEAKDNYTAVATLTRQVTQAEVALLDAKAAAAADEEKQATSGDAVARIVAVAQKLPAPVRARLREALEAVW